MRILFNYDNINISSYFTDQSVFIKQTYATFIILLLEWKNAIFSVIYYPPNLAYKLIKYFNKQQKL